MDDLITSSTVGRTSTSRLLQHLETTVLRSKERKFSVRKASTKIMKEKSRGLEFLPIYYPGPYHQRGIAGTTFYES